MTYVIGALAGLAWGGLAAFVNYLILKSAVKKGSNNAIVCTNLLRTAVDVAALGTVFLLRKYLPFSFEACILAAALIMGIGAVFFAFKAARS